MTLGKAKPDNAAQCARFGGRVRGCWVLGAGRKPGIQEQRHCDEGRQGTKEKQRSLYTQSSSPTLGYYSYTNVSRFISKVLAHSGSVTRIRMPRGMLGPFPMLRTIVARLEYTLKANRGAYSGFGGSGSGVGSRDLVLES